MRAALRRLPLIVLAGVAALAVAMTVVAGRGSDGTTTGAVGDRAAPDPDLRESGVMSPASTAPAASEAVSTAFRTGSAGLRPLRPPPSITATTSASAPATIETYMAAVRAIRERFESVLDQTRMLHADWTNGLVSRERVGVVAALIPIVARRAAEELRSLPVPPAAELHRRRLGHTLSTYAAAATPTQPFTSGAARFERDTGMGDPRAIQTLALARYFDTPDDPRAHASR